MCENLLLEKKQTNSNGNGLCESINQTEVLESSNSGIEIAKLKIQESEDPFYTKAQQYWSSVPATVNGMLGGFGAIDNVDIKGSEKFLRDIFKQLPEIKKRYVLDCGAGIGRVSKNLLIPIFEKVDLVEQDKHFTETAKENIGSDNQKLGKIYNCGLQKFVPEPAKYDLIWCQWVLGHLSDEDLLKFFKRLKLGLNKDAIFILKENVTSSDSLEVDDTDSSVTRPLKAYKKVLKLAEYEIVKLVKQTNFPKPLYPVYIIAAKPKKIVM